MKTNTPKFHIAHFPVGTIVEYECPTAGYRPREEREATGEDYNRKIATVVSLKENGVNSWVFENTEWQDSSKSLDACNISWIRCILKRGTGKLTEQDQILVDELRKRRYDYMEANHPGYNQRKEQSFQTWGIPTSGNKYRIEYLNGFVGAWLRDRGYLNDLDQHLYNMDLIQASVWEAMRPYIVVRPDSYFESTYVVVSKKKFAKIMSRILAKAKHSRKKEERRVYDEQMREYERDMMSDYDNGDY